MQVEHSFHSLKEAASMEAVIAMDNAHLFIQKTSEN